MKKYSGGYLPINPNFIISNIMKKNEIPNDLFGYTSIVKNIIFRGTPTNPSTLIKERYNFNKKYGGYCYFEENKDINWDLVIKGSNNSNPAISFYNKLKVELPEYYMYFLPECPVNLILNGDDIPKDSAVDFYSPMFKLIVEIDGIQHSDAVHSETDKVRDDNFVKAGIKTLRLSTTNFVKDINSTILEIQNIIKNESFFSSEKNGVKKLENIDIDEMEILYLFRMQICFIELIENGYIDLFKSNTIELKVAHNIKKEVFDLAINDLLNTFRHLYILDDKNVEFGLFEVKVVDQFSGYNNSIDIDIFKKYDNSLGRENVLYVRNDYFLYPIWGVQDSTQNYAYFKNYYTVSIADKRFNNVDELNENHIKSLQYFLKLIYNFDDFRPNQLRIICNGLNYNQSVVGLLPTGSGKSLCFQIISFLTPGVSLAVSPLSMLMEDQCRNLFERNKVSSSYYINSSEHGRDNINALKNLNTKILYVSPERFFNEDFKKLIFKNSCYISQIIIDEVHCLSEWGHDFRTSYLLLFNILQELGLKDNTLLIGVSATSSPRVSTDIKNEFKKLKKNCVFIRSITTKRKELNFNVIKINHELERSIFITNKIEENFKQNKKSLIFVPYKKDTSDLHFTLTKSIKNLTAGLFKGDIDANDKRDVLKKYKNGQYNVVIATKSFGMGLDVVDIRETIHSHFSSSVESMYQEMGRAGRDEKPSQCTIILNSNDICHKKILDVFKDKNKFLSTNIYDKGELGELDKQFFLIKNSKKTPDVESMISISIIKFIENKPSYSFREISSYIRSSIDYSITQIDLEQILFRLYTIGLVSLWGLNYKNGTSDPLFTNVNFNNLSIVDLNRNLKNYINKYDTTYDKKCKDLNDVITTICTWSHENFFDNKWNSLRTLYDFVYNFTSSTEFSERIDNYFSENILLDKAVNNTKNYKYWLQVIESSEANILVDQLSRYIEEYKNHIVVNFLSGITRLNVNDFDSMDGKNRLNDSFNQIKESKVIDKYLFITDLLKYINKDSMTIFILFLFEYHTEFYNFDSVQSYIISSMKHTEKEILNKSINLIILKNKMIKLKNLIERD